MEIFEGPLARGPGQAAWGGLGGPVLCFLTLTQTPAFPPLFLPRLCIVNDELFVRNATTEEIRKAFLMPAPTPSSSPVPTLSAEQQEMLAAFSMQSGMNLEWSQK